MPRAKHTPIKLHPEDLSRRREIVWALYSQGQKPHEIVRYLRDTATLADLIVGYKNPYMAVMTDLKHSPNEGMRRKVPEKEYDRAVGEAIARLDEQYTKTWTLLEKHTDGIVGENENRLEIVDATSVQLLKHLEDLTSKRAALMGVTPDVKVESAPGTAIGQLNILGTNPREWLSHVVQVSEAIRQEPMTQAYNVPETARITTPSD